MSIMSDNTQSKTFGLNPRKTGNTKPDNLFLSTSQSRWIISAHLSVVILHFFHIPLWMSAFCLLLIAGRYFIDLKKLRPPGTLVRTLLVVTGLTGILLQYQSIFGRDPGIALLLVMLCLKLLELKKSRDVMLILLMDYFVLVTNFLRDQPIYLAAYMLLAVTLITATIISVQHPAKQKPAFTRLKQAGTLLIQAIPLMLLMFVLFPRVPGPIWSLPEDAYSGLTGLSDSMTPGDIGHLSRSNEVAFRVQFDGEPPEHSQLYWRGPVMTRTTGDTWKVGPSGTPEHDLYRTVDRPSAYQITLEPHNQHWLFTLDVPEIIPDQSFINNNLQLINHEPVRERKQYRVVSYLGFEYLSDLNEFQRKKNTQLPPRSNPKTAAFARQLFDQSASASDYIDKILLHFRTAPYVYTLTPPRLGNHAVDRFLFESRKGFCEHYASALVTMMRSVGIPARIVTGYQGGEYNEIGDYMIVRQSDAHAWTEVWLQRRGWVRVDPTAAISPLRIESGIEAALPDHQAMGGWSRSQLQWLRQLGLTWDSVNNAWNQWVIAYGPEKQLEFFRNLGFETINANHMAIGLTVCSSIILVMFYLFMSRNKHNEPSDPLRLIYEQFCNKLKHRGIAKLNWEGPQSYADRVCTARPDLSRPVYRITHLYIRLRYGRGSKHLNAAQFKTDVRNFHPPALSRKRKR